MLISITNQCKMGCSHCIDDAQPIGEHMSMRTFRDAISFFNQFGGIECVITGGEPTENPNFWEMIYEAGSTAHGSTGTGVAHITVTTNAMNLVNNPNEYNMLVDVYKKFKGKITFQVTNVDKYYPIHIDQNDDIFCLENVVLCTEIEAMYPMGRAKTNNMPWNSKASKCFNIRSLVRSTKSLEKSTLYLNLNSKFCTPQIDINGGIKLGESCLCPVVSSIYKPTEQIIKDICNFTCKGCDMINCKLTTEQRLAIGEI